VSAARPVAWVLVTALAALAALPAAAGRLRDDLELVSRDVRELQRLLEQEQQRNAELERQIAELRRLTGVDEPGRLGAADLAARLDGLDRDLQVLFENQNEARGRLSVLSDKLDALYRHQSVFGVPADAEAAAMAEAGIEGGEAAPAAQGGDLPPAPPVPGEAVELAEDGGPQAMAPPAGGLLLDPEELYRAARADYGRGDYALAVDGFQEFARRFPDSELTDNARYWLGESRWAQRDFEGALAAFDEVLQLHPNGDKAADAGLKRGLCLIEMNRMADGIIQLQHVKDANPGTPAARLAREKLESLGLM
jgi:tol-pal system protein YbgF